MHVYPFNATDDAHSHPKYIFVIYLSSIAYENNTKVHYNA